MNTEQLSRMISLLISQPLLLLSSTWASQTSSPARTCDPPVPAGGDGPTEVSMMTVVVLVLATMVILALLLRLLQLQRRLQAAQSGDPLGYSTFCRSARYTLKQLPLVAAPTPPKACHPAPPRLPLPLPPSLPLPPILSHCTPPSLRVSAAPVAHTPLDHVVAGCVPYSRLSDPRQTRVFLFEHSTL